MMGLCDINFQHGNSLQRVNCKNVTSKCKSTNAVKEQIIKGTTQSNTKKNEDKRKIARKTLHFFSRKEMAVRRKAGGREWREL